MDKLRLEGRGQISVLVVAAMVLVGFLIIAVILIASEPVSLGIVFIHGKENVSKGEDMGVYYKVSNYWLKSIKSVNLTRWVEDEYGKEIPNSRKVENIKNAKWFSPTEGVFNQPTWLLQPGEYRIFVRVEYLNIWDRPDFKELSLIFRVKET